MKKKFLIPFFGFAMMLGAISLTGIEEVSARSMADETCEDINSNSCCKYGKGSCGAGVVIGEFQ